MSGDSPLFTLAEVAAHNSALSCWIVLDDRVYDVTKFLLEHPGGEEVILGLAGKDATDEFNDVGHSSDARAMAEDFLVGRLHPDCQRNAKEPRPTASAVRVSWADVLLSPTWTNFLIPLGISISVYALFKVSQRVFGHQ